MNRFSALQFFSVDYSFGHSITEKSVMPSSAISEESSKEFHVSMFTCRR